MKRTIALAVLVAALGVLIKLSDQARRRGRRRSLAVPADRPAHGGPGRE